MSDRWIVIRNWDTFQHYGDREPPWVKVYTALLTNDDWLGLTPTDRSALLALWLAYAKTRRRLREDTVKLSRTCAQRITKGTLERLNEAGFIEFSASKPLATRAHAREVEVEVDPPNPPNGGAKGSISKRQLRKFTGCRQTRGSHGFGYVRDPLGTDKPPQDWPHERPSNGEIEAALATTPNEGGKRPPEGA